MKKLITLTTAILMSQVLLAQITLIPDANFEQALITLGYDTGTPDGSVLTANINTVTYLYVSNHGISDLTGIEDFTALTTLQCGINQLTSLDVSNNSALTFLNCYDNQLTSLDVSNNSALTQLYCQVNQLTSLDVSQNVVLRQLFCFSNQLADLNISGISTLTTICCQNNLLTELDVSLNINLDTLGCQENQLVCLNVNTGNNINMLYAIYNYNPNLTCIEVDNVSYATTSWTAPYSIDATASFSANCGNNCSSTPTGIEKNTVVFNVYPNPASDYFVVEAEGSVNLIMYNVIGEVVYEKYINSKYIVSTSQLLNGVYIVRAINENGSVYSQKIIKE